MRASWIVVIGWSVAVAVGCARSEPHAELGTTTVTYLGTAEFAPSIRGRDGGYSARFGDRSIWLFGDTALEVEATDGSRWRTSTFTTTTDFDASDGIHPFIEPLDANGAPGQFVPFTAEEAAHNAQVDACDGCDHKWVLWPGDIAVHPQRDWAWVFYWKIWDWESQGAGLARWSDPEQPLERVTPALFDGARRDLGTALMVVEDDLYAYGCSHQGWFNFSCVVGRAPFDDVADAEAWGFWDGTRWGALEDAVSVMNAASLHKVFYNPHIDRYVVLYSTEDSHIVARTARAPEGPWSREAFLFSTDPHPEGDPIYDALAHPEFDESGRSITVSYTRATGFLAADLHLARIDLQ